MEIGKMLGKPRGKGYQLAIYIAPDKAQAFADALYYLLQTDPLISKSEWIISATLDLADFLREQPPISSAHYAASR